MEVEDSQVSAPGHARCAALTAACVSHELLNGITVDTSSRCHAEEQASKHNGFCAESAV